jgi:hypothetical protein
VEIVVLLDEHAEHDRPLSVDYFIPHSYQTIWLRQLQDFVCGEVIKGVMCETQ